MSVSIGLVGVPAGDADVDMCGIGELLTIPPVTNPSELRGVGALPALTAGDACGVPPADADCALVLRFCVSDGECAGGSAMRASMLIAFPAVCANVAGAAEAAQNATTLCTRKSTPNQLFGIPSKQA